MAFVPEMEHDVFVSYAHVDNQKASEQEKGWVDSFVENFRIALDQKLGRIGAASIWWDKTNLRPNDPVTSEIQGKVQKSATLLLILSQGYQESEWCQQELKTFVEQHGESTKRVFVVGLQPSRKIVNLPSILQDRISYDFWHRDTSTERIYPLTIYEAEEHKITYTRRVNDAAEDISEQLKALEAATPIQPPEPKATVYLAEVTDDLRPRRDQILRHLKHEGFAVLPKQRDLEGDAFKQALQVELPQCQSFIQLLGEIPGRTPPGMPQGYTRYQWEQAQAEAQKREPSNHLPILQWHDPALVLDEVSSQAQKELLRGNMVFVESLESFKDRIVKVTLEPPPKQAEPISNDRVPFVFINAEKKDRSLALKISDHVGDHLFRDLPIEQGSSSEMRADLEDKLLDCDALIIVYGNASVGWVSGQLRHYNRISPRRREPLRILAVYDGPPEDKPIVDAKMPDLQIIPCRDALDPKSLHEFLKPLGGV